MKLFLRFHLVLLCSLASLPAAHAGAAPKGAAPKGGAPPVVTSDLAITTTIDPVKSYELTWMRGVVRNQGPADAADVVVTHRATPGLFVHWSTCNVDDRKSPSCNLGTIPAGEQRSYELWVHAPESGPLTVTGSVSSAGADANPGDNTASSSVTVEPAPFADVSVRTEIGSAAVQPGVVAYQVTVHNAGPFLATPLVYGNVYGAEAAQAIATQGSCVTFPLEPWVDGRAGYLCRLGELAAGATATVVVTGAATQYSTEGHLTRGETHHDSFVQSEFGDPMRENNVSTMTAYPTSVGFDGDPVPPVSSVWEIYAECRRYPTRDCLPV